MSTIDDNRADVILRVEEIRGARKATKYNHLFRTLLGIPPHKEDKPLCGADRPYSRDSAATNRRPPCPHCEQARERELALAEQLRGVSS
jgi:hypothetical protein